MDHEVINKSEPVRTSQNKSSAVISHHQHCSLQERTSRLTCRPSTAYSVLTRSPLRIIFPLACPRSLRGFFQNYHITTILPYYHITILPYYHIPHRTIHVFDAIFVFFFPFSPHLRRSLPALPHPSTTHDGNKS